MTIGVAGTGSGLIGEYYSAQLQTFIPPATLTRTDPAIDFEWGTGSPDPSITADTFTVRWSGQVQPFYSQTYTFYTTTDDGVRLWVDGQLLIDKWINQPPTEWSGAIPLIANQKYNLMMEFYENAVGATAHLRWSSPAQAKQTIPTTQLYPAAGPLQPAFTASVSGGVTTLTITWTGPLALESAPEVTGPWSSAGATSPYVLNIDPNTQQLFFRLVSQ